MLVGKSDIQDFLPGFTVHMLFKLGIQMININCSAAVEVGELFSVGGDLCLTFNFNCPL